MESNRNWKLLLPMVFMVYSFPVFVKVFLTSQMVVDEELNLRQGLFYCNDKFIEEDNDISTLPGLFIFSAILVPFDLCSVLGLRLICLFAAVVNLVAMYEIRLMNLKNVHFTLAALDAFTLSALPPLYFFSHLFYTDTVSIAMLLMFYLHWQRDEKSDAAIFGTIGVFTNQKNAAWAIMVFGITFLDIVTKIYADFKNIGTQEVKLYQLKVIWEIVSNFELLIKCILRTLIKEFLIIFPMLPIIGLLCTEGSLTKGDPQFNNAALHIPQLFYFSIFCLIFGVSNTLCHLRPTVKLILKEKLIFIFFTGVFIVIVKRNTLVHPYLLADNRHYTYYIWQFLYGRYSWFRYAMCPLYVLALMLVHQGLKHLRFSVRLMFWLSVFLYLCFEKLLEIRCFLIPFILFRLNCRPNFKNRVTQWIELGFYVILNALAFYIFFTKEIEWKTLSEPQRLIW